MTSPLLTVSVGYSLQVVSELWGLAGLLGVNPVSQLVCRKYPYNS